MSHICSDNEIITTLSNTGHLRHPFGHPQDVPRDVFELPLTHQIIEKGLASYQDFMAVCLDPLCMHHHGRPAQHTGVIGPATRDLLAQPRCGCCDYGEDVAAATGTGSWSGCHDVGDFHAATVYVDESGMPGFLRPLFQNVWDNVVASYAALGLQFTRVDDYESGNIAMSFVRRAPGWIGLAVVGSDQSCGSQIWCRYLSTYKPSDVVTEWTTLVKHEFGHNAGLHHTRGGVMNPGIINGLPVSWKGDPSEAVLNKKYGGKPIAPEPPDPPTPGPTPPTETFKAMIGINDTKVDLDLTLSEDAGRVGGITTVTTASKVYELNNSLRSVRAK